MVSIAYASILAAVLMAPALHLIGLPWSWAWPLSCLWGFGLGFSAAEGLGYL